MPKEYGRIMANTSFWAYQPTNFNVGNDCNAMPENINIHIYRQQCYLVHFLANWEWPLENEMPALENCSIKCSWTLGIYPHPFKFVLVHGCLMFIFLKGNLILLCIFFSPSIVAVSVPFTEAQNRKRLREVYKIPNKSRFCGRLPFCMHMSLLLGKCINACPMFPPNQVQ